LQKSQGVADLRNVRGVLEISSIFQPTDRLHLAAFILPSQSVEASSLSHPLSGVSSATTTPSDARQNAMLNANCESRCAGRLSALIDGMVRLQ